jgi:hypothetical protein
MAGRPLSKAVRCRYKTFFVAPSALFRESYATIGLMVTGKEDGKMGTIRWRKEN